MKRFLLVALVASLFTMTGAAEVLWSGSISTGAWGYEENKSAVVVPAEKFTMAKAGDKIVVSATADGQDPAIGFIGANSWGAIDGVSNTALSVDGTVEFPLSADAITLMKEEGIRVMGNNVILTKIELVSNAVLQLSTLWEGNYRPDWGAGEAQVAADKLSMIEEGDFIQFTISEISGDDWPKILLWEINGTSEKEIADIPFFDDKEAEMPLTKSVEVTSDNIEKFKKGFYVAGCGVVLSKISLLKSLPAGIQNIADCKSEKVNVYGLNGSIVREGVNVKDAFSGLASGIYVVDGKKYLVS